MPIYLGFDEDVETWRQIWLIGIACLFNSFRFDISTSSPTRDSDNSCRWLKGRGWGQTITVPWTQVGIIV